MGFNLARLWLSKLGVDTSIGWAWSAPSGWDRVRVAAKTWCGHVPSSTCPQARLIVFAFCTTSFTREKVPGTCKPLVKCVWFFHEIQEVKNRPCTLKTGETGVCCPYFNLPKRPSKYQCSTLCFHNDTYCKLKGWRNETRWKIDQLTNLAFLNHKEILDISLWYSN